MKYRLSTNIDNNTERQLEIEKLQEKCRIIFTQISGLHGLWIKSIFYYITAVRLVLPIIFLSKQSAYFLVECRNTEI